MRIGEILLRHRWCGEDDLAIVLADQRLAQKRTCSLLIVRGVVEPDQAAKALAEQFGIAAALTKHLENRDRSLEKLLPSNIARQHFAIPLGKMRDGEIVICVRDPKPNLQAAFERVMQKPVLITVAAAHSLEPIIEMTYAPVVTQDFGVRFGRPSTAPVNVPNQPPPPAAFAAGTVRNSDAVPEDFDIDVDSASHAAPAMPETFTICSLDDDGVDKDFSQHDLKNPTTLPPGVGQPRQTTLPPPNTTRTPAKKP